MGSALFNFYKYGKLKAEGSSITEGIGQGRETANLVGAPIDDAYQITDEEALTHHCLTVYFKMKGFVWAPPAV